MNLEFLYPIIENFDEKLFEKRIQIYKKLLNQFNPIHNLTHLKNIDDNILDSINILKFYNFSQAKIIADIGSGAGFPSIFLAFFLQSNFHLFEPNPKKAAFLRTVKIECELTHLNIHKEKVQNFHNDFKADIITSRALMDVKPLLQICSKLCDEKTVFVLWKGSEIYEELKNLTNYQIFENHLRKYCIINYPLAKASELSAK